MELTWKRAASYTAILLIAVAVTQAAYTVLYVAAPEMDRLFLWRIEATLFIVLSAVAGAAFVKAKSLTLGWSAIFVSAILNFVQVGVGLVMFGPFREAAEAAESAAPMAGSIVAFSFFIYNGAKALLGLAAIVFGMAKLNAGGKALGGLTAFVGVVAFVSNIVVMAFGLSTSITGGGLMPSGASGVLATVLLAVCLLSLKSDD